MNDLDGLLSSPLFLFILLLIFSHLIYLRIFQKYKPGVESGAFVLAINTYVLACLPFYHLPVIIMLLVTLELLIIWMYISLGLMQSYLNHDLHFNHHADRLALGYWVAGTALLVLLLNQAALSLQGLVVLLSILAVILYVIYAVIFMRWLWLSVCHRFHLHASGMILLATVSTQAISLLLITLFRHDAPLWMYQCLIGFGFIFYPLGLIAIVMHLLNAHSHSFIKGWGNVSSLIHGALSITGLAILEAQGDMNDGVVYLWSLTLALIVLIELFDLFRFILKVKSHGFIREISIYHASQWVRLFAFSMFYAFTVLYYQYAGGGTSLSASIIYYGQYMITLFFVAQLVMAITHVINQEKAV